MVALHVCVILELGLGIPPAQMRSRSSMEERKPSTMVESGSEQCRYHYTEGIVITKYYGTNYLL